jgi:outer membrane immunogenic protein
MLRKILLSTVLIAAAAGSAAAADLPRRGVAPAPYLAAPVFTWTGFYVGLNAGAGWNNNRGIATTVDTLVNPIYGIGDNSNDAGFTGGVQAGYNMQFGSFVAGVEADINYIDRNGGNNNGAFPAAPATAGTDFLVSRGGNSNNWFGTLRGRLGFAFDRFLVFGTGGLAFGGNSGGGIVQQRDYAVAPGVPVVTTLAGNNGDDNNVGWALGGGMEYAFSNSMSFKVEYLHVALGNKNNSFTTLPAAAGTSTYAGGDVISLRNQNKFDIVRAGVNFRF